MDHEVEALGRTLFDESAEPTALKFALLQHITDCFSDERRIGHGGFSVVYKGVVGREMVAVKRLTKTLEEKTFHKEIECLVKAKHKNIVRFLGCCAETQAQFAHHEGKFVMADTRVWLLCFEYVPNGSLDKYIADASCGLEWTKHYKIIKGICDGLCYLHDNHILHSDLKPANILIDDHMIPKIADFGLSRCLDEEQTRAFTTLPCGTLGYLAPELFREQFAFAPDIYSVGVIIGEILKREKGCPKVENVIERWKNRLEGDMELEQVRVCTKIGIECMESDLRKRPTARHIVDMLYKETSIVESRITSSQFEQAVNVY